MQVTVAKSAGFCFGVQRAVDTVYEQVEKGIRPIYTYGPIFIMKWLCRIWKKEESRFWKEKKIWGS